MFVITLMLFMLVDATPHQAQGPAFLPAYTPALASEIGRREHTDALGVNRVAQVCKFKFASSLRPHPKFTTTSKESPSKNFSGMTGRCIDVLLKSEYLCDDFMEKSSGTILQIYSTVH
jgi:hypothetical protein